MTSILDRRASVTASRPAETHLPWRRSLGAKAWFAVKLLLVCVSGLYAQTKPTEASAAAIHDRVAIRTTAELLESQRRFHSDPTNTALAWKFARAVFERAEYATNNAERAALAVQGIDACRQTLARDPKSAPAHFYLGMNLGQLARTKLLGALPLVAEMERAFQMAAELDERFARAGPDRCLGLLYYEAPAIGSVGSRAKARKHLERAAELAPEFPENRLNLAEAYLKWRDKKLLRRELDALEKIWSTAKTNFAGADWEAAWLDWTQRRDRLRQNAETSVGPLPSPHASD